MVGISGNEGTRLALPTAKATAKASPAALKIAAAAYGAKTKPQYAVGLNRWLKVGQYENFLPSPQAVKRTEARKLLKVDGRAGGMSGRDYAPLRRGRGGRLAG